FDTLYPPPVFTFRLFRLGDNYSDTGGVARDASSSLAVIEQCGHVCNVEQPEQFNRRTLAFIQSLGGGRK
ncbi:alpha/beta fold hydrolase, partial [Aeromonas veronii]|uniref:alpha/beta fold hydrolase n=1 Tax=Aeromonas veronii TaxID=654 RepID=UPI003AAEE0BB